MPTKPVQSVRSRTEKEYLATLKYLTQWQTQPESGKEFSDFLLWQTIAQAAPDEIPTTSPFKTCFR
jgi:hypothetical protein